MKNDQPDWLVATLSAIAVLATSLVYLDYNPLAFEDAPLADEPIPPQEFLVGNPSRTPSNIDLPAAMRLRAYEYLDEHERRTLFRAVIYFCNENVNEFTCGHYVEYCGDSCRKLIRARSR
jgi:hypothetical protein